CPPAGSVSALRSEGASENSSRTATSRLGAENRGWGRSANSVGRTQTKIRRPSEVPQGKTSPPRQRRDGADQPEQAPTEDDRRRAEYRGPEHDQSPVRPPPRLAQPVLRALPRDHDAYADAAQGEPHEPHEQGGPDLAPGVVDRHHQEDPDG